MSEHWDYIDNDLHAVYSIDVWDIERMRTTPWPWLKRRILGLLAEETKISRWARNKAK